MIAQSPQHGKELLMADDTAVRQTVEVKVTITEVGGLWCVSENILYDI